MSNAHDGRSGGTSAPKLPIDLPDVKPTTRSLDPGELGPARMNPINEERAAANAQIHRTLKAWRAASGAAGQAGVPKGAGVPLASNVRSKMAPKLGANLDSVRVHTSGESAEAAKGFGARAFTVGEDIHFNSGEFQPGTKEGDRLLAHELTHVVQGQKSGVQRKADDANGDKEPKDGGAGTKEGGDKAEVSDPNEPAETEADATADSVADEMHGDDGKDDKKNGKDKKKGGDKHAARDGDGEKEESGGDKGSADAKGDGKEDAQKDEAKDAGAEKAPAIGAKLDGIGRKIFLAAKPGAAPGAAPGATGAGATPGAAAKPDLKTPADVRKFCAADPIAIQKLDDVDGETNIDPGDGSNVKAKDDFYKKVMEYVNGNPLVPPGTIFNSCFNSSASEWKFKGKKITKDAISRMCSRAVGVPGWWFSAAKKEPFEREAQTTLGPGADKGTIDAMAQNLWKQRLKDGASVMSSLDTGATIAPTGSTWFSPDKLKLTGTGDIGYSELMQILALQPEWFPEGNVVFELQPSAFSGEARKPTAYDGMQSAHWVSRPQTEDTYGVTGGGAKEFIAGNVKASGIVSAKAVIPSADMKQQIQTAVTTARDHALAADPALKQAIDNEKDPKAKQKLEYMIPTLTDQLIRGDLSFGSVPAMVKNICNDTIKSTGLERQQPTANKNPSGTGKRP